jgi:hypothetical protein
MWSIIAASVVDLPEPVGPVTSTSPRGLWQRSFTTAGKPIDSIGGISYGILRSTPPHEPRWWKRFTRKRARPSMP